MERTDGILRMLRINYAFSQDDKQEFNWSPVLRTFSYLEDEVIAKLQDSTRAVLHHMVLDRENANSVFNIVTKARENARAVQDHIPKELWQCLNDFYHLVRNEKLGSQLKHEDPVTVLDSLIRQGLLFYGTTEITVARGEGFNYMNIGKYLERALQTADILDVKFSDLSYDLDKTPDTTYWKYLLLSISGYSLYLKTYRSGFEARNVIEQVVFNTHFPRSILYSLDRLHRYFERLKANSDLKGFEKITFMIGKNSNYVRFSNVEIISGMGLHQFLTQIKTDLLAISKELNRQYFANT
jgi:uncharacterized alpha-E superfamily protein